MPWKSVYQHHFSFVCHTSNIFVFRINRIINPFRTATYVVAPPFFGDRLRGAVYCGPAAPVAYQPGTWCRSVSWVRISRVHARKNSRGLFLVHKLICGKRESELATLHEKWTSSGIAEPLCAIKIEGKNRRGKGTAPVTTACPKAGKYRVDVWHKYKIYIHTYMWNIYWSPEIRNLIMYIMEVLQFLYSYQVEVRSATRFFWAQTAWNDYCCKFWFQWYNTR